jgi:hypothetical protein
MADYPTRTAKGIAVMPRLKTRSAVLALLAISTCCQAGCALPFAANLLHAVGADMVPAEYGELEEMSVAVITSTDGSQYSQDVVARELNRMVGAILSNEVKELKLIRQDQIDQWLDVHGWDTTNFAAVGRGVKADKLIVIEVADLKLQEGATLFRGRSDAQIEVIDVATGETEYSRRLDDYTYPKLAGQDITETTEARFRKLYLSMLSKEIARSFHPYDLTDRIAADSVIASY